jgi:hypothetical protein
MPRGRLVPLAYDDGNRYCEGCRDPVVAGELVEWREVMRRDGLLPTIYCAKCAG